MSDETANSDPSRTVSPFLSLAASIYNAPGVYAALVGAGMSTEAGLKTGRDVTRGLAELEALHIEGNVPKDVDAWWTRVKSVPLSYSALVEAIAPTAGQRQALLRSVVEPSVDEIAAGLKVPTAAHQGLADLVLSGFVRIIITTNFDRLIESALHAAGIEEQVLSGPEDLTGMVPLQHTRCTVIKFHGDYLQANLRNTESELIEYEGAWGSLLRRVLDEYGLFTVGWSGASDTALRSEIKNVAGRRYGCYLGVRGDVDPALRPLLEDRRATILQVTSATTFFDQLTGTLREVSQRPARPLATSATVGATKRLLSQGRTRIDLRELLLREAQLLKSWLDGYSLPNEATYQADLEEIVVRSEPVVAALAAGSFYGDPEQDPLWLSVFRLVAAQPVPIAGWDAGIALRRLPATLSLYASALSAWAAERPDLVLRLLSQSFRGPLYRPSGATVVYCPAAVALAPPQVLDARLAAPDWAYQWPIRFSNIVVESVKPLLVDQFPVEVEFAFAFEDLEYLMALLQYDWHSVQGITDRIGWQPSTFHRGLILVQPAVVGPQPPSVLERFLSKEGPLKATTWSQRGGFGGDRRRFSAAVDAVKAGLST